MTSRQEATQLVAQGSVMSSPCSVRTQKSVKMADLLQPHKIEEGLALYFLLFERVYVNNSPRFSWVQRLLPLQPLEAVGVIARLPEEQATGYDTAKEALLRRYNLSSEAFRVKFCSVTKRRDQTFKFCLHFESLCNGVEWLRGENGLNDKYQLVDLLYLEQFLQNIPGFVRRWWLGRPQRMSLENTSILADDFLCRGDGYRDNRPLGPSVQIKTKTD